MAFDDEDRPWEVFALRHLRTVGQPNRDPIQILRFDYVWWTRASPPSQRGTQKLLLLSRDWNTGGDITFSVHVDDADLRVDEQNGTVVVKNKHELIAAIDIRDDEAKLAEGAVMWRSFGAERKSQVSPRSGD